MFFLPLMLPKHNKPYSYNAFLAFYYARPQTSILLHYFPAFSVSRTQQTLCFHAFLLFQLPEPNRTQQTLVIQCFLAFYALWQACAPPAPLHHQPSLWTLPESITSRTALKKGQLVVFWEHNKQESIGNIKFAVFWKQKKQENIVIIMFFVFWDHKNQERHCHNKVWCVLER